MKTIKEDENGNLFIEDTEKIPDINDIFDSLSGISLMLIDIANKLNERSVEKCTK